MIKYLIFIRMPGGVFHRIQREFRNDWEMHDTMLCEFPHAESIIPQRLWRVH